jgi:Fic family protein
LLTRHAARLPEVIGDPRYRDFVQECEAKYRHWAKVRIIARQRGLDAELAWLLIKYGREQRYKIVPLRGASTDVRFLVPDHAHEELTRIDQQLAGLLGPDDGALTPSRGEELIRTALREEAIASSMIEGAATTRVEAKRMLQSNRKPRTRGERMIINNYQAIQFLRERKSANLTPELLLEIQSILTENTLDDPEEAGRFRDSNDRVTVIDQRDGEVMHTPPPADELPARLDMLCRFANRTVETPFIHPVVRACLLHFQIGYDHPFCDGNGRTARAIFFWSMLRDGYWIFEYLPFSRQIHRSVMSYNRAYLYTETDGFDATYFVVYNLRVISRIRDEFAQYLQRKREGIRSAQRLTRSDPDLNHRQRDIVMRLVRDPDVPMTIAEHADRHGVVYETARTDFATLIERGYADQRRIGKRYEFLVGKRLRDRVRALEAREFMGE